LKGIGYSGSALAVYTLSRTFKTVSNSRRKADGSAFALWIWETRIAPPASDTYIPGQSNPELRLPVRSLRGRSANAREHCREVVADVRRDVVAIAALDTGDGLGEARRVGIAAGVVVVLDEDGVASAADLD
jgi:hypothetical protein